MRRHYALLIVLVCGIAAAVLHAHARQRPAAQPSPPAPLPAPVAPQPPKPRPCPGPGPCPRVRPWAGAAVGGRDDAIQLDLPGDLQIHNTGGSDGSGLCVFASMHHAGVWQSDPVFAGLFEWMKRHPGGGYPEKVDKVIAQYCQEKGLAKPAYLQVQGTPAEILAAATLACAAGRMPGVTYSRSPTGRYGGGRIAHMVNLVRADDAAVWVLDNNYPGSDKYEKMTPDEFMRVCKPDWLVVTLNPPPPPVPHN